jgi:hypothetical protein
MEIELHTPHCEHPFGDGIHIIKAEGKIAVAMMEALKLHHDVGEGFHKLSSMLDPEHDRAVMCALYRGEPPEGMASAWMVVRMVLVADEKEKHGHWMEMKALTVMAEEGYEQLAESAAKEFKAAFKALPL